MQLPGMATDPVRTSIDLTWWPLDDTYGVSFRVWLQDLRTGQWVLQEMRTSGTPLRHAEVADRWRSAAHSASSFHEQLRAQHNFDPFT